MFTRTIQDQPINTVPFWVAVNQRLSRRIMDKKFTRFTRHFPARAPQAFPPGRLPRSTHSHLLICGGPCSSLPLVKPTSGWTPLRIRQSEVEFTNSPRRVKLAGLILCVSKGDVCGALRLNQPKPCPSKASELDQRTSLWLFRLTRYV